jgi:hypothetical protein
MVQVGAEISAALKATPPQVKEIFFGEHAAHTDFPVGNSWFDDFCINWTDGTFPLKGDASGGGRRFKAYMRIG